MRINFKAETLEKVGDRKVLWVSDGCRYESFESFLERADFWYDPGYGAEYITRLTIMFDDGTWMTRAEYDGAEWWELHRPPKRPDEQGNVEILTLFHAKDVVYEDPNIMGPDTYTVAWQC